MAMRSVTDLIADVRYRADVQSLTARHPDANITRLINESWQTLREMMSDAGYPHFLIATTGTLSVGQGEPLPGTSNTMLATFSTIPVPTNAVRVYGVDVLVRDETISLEPVPFAARGDYHVRGKFTGRPLAFCIVDVGREMGDSVYVPGRIAILPAADAAYPYTLWYLPQWIDHSGTNQLNAMAGYEQWVIWDCVVKISARDNDHKNTYQIALQERAREQERIMRAVDKLQRASARRVDDTRGRRRLNQVRAGRWR